MNLHDKNSDKPFIAQPLKSRPATSLAFKIFAGVIVTVIALVFAGIALAAAEYGQEEKEAEPAAAEPVQRNVAYVPDECLTALDEIDDILAAAAVGLNYGGEAMGMIPEALEAGMEYDTVAVQRLTERLEVISTDLAAKAEIVKASKFQENAHTCRQIAKETSNG